MNGQLQSPAGLTSWKNRNTHWTGGWLGLSADMKVFEKKKYFADTEIWTPGCAARSLVITETENQEMREIIWMASDTMQFDIKVIHKSTDTTSYSCLSTKLHGVTSHDSNYDGYDY
jgi:hypothetical protein